MNERHPNSARFHQILKEAGELHDRKQRDYGRGADPFANIRASAEFGVKPWIGAYVRLNDKIARIKSFIEKGNLVNESLEDSLRDVIVYAAIALVLYEQDIQLHVSTGSESAHSPAPQPPASQRSSESQDRHLSVGARNQGQQDVVVPQRVLDSYLEAHESERHMPDRDDGGLKRQSADRPLPKLSSGHTVDRQLRHLEQLQSLVPQEEAGQDTERLVW